jgi:hypothetical protein
MAVDLLDVREVFCASRQRHNLAVPRSNLETFVIHAIVSVVETAGTHPLELTGQKLHRVLRRVVSASRDFVQDVEDGRRVLWLKVSEAELLCQASHSLVVFGPSRVASHHVVAFQSVLITLLRHSIKRLVEFGLVGFLNSAYFLFWVARTVGNMVGLKTLAGR